MLFIRFINDLDYVVSDKASFKLFADGHKLCSPFNILSSQANLSMFTIYIGFDKKLAASNKSVYQLGDGNPICLLLMITSQLLLSYNINNFQTLALELS